MDHTVGDRGPHSCVRPHPGRPYGRNHTNPPATNEFKWTDPQAEAIAKNSCYDCHSNQTNWWWATSIAPFSWLTQPTWIGGAGVELLRVRRFPVGGRVPEDHPGRDAARRYTLIHPSAKLAGASRRCQRTLPAPLLNGGATTGDGMARRPGTSYTAGAAPPRPRRQRDDRGHGQTTTSADAAAIAVINQVCASCHSAQPRAQLPREQRSRGQGPHRRHDQSRGHRHGRPENRHSSSTSRAETSAPCGRLAAPRRPAPRPSPLALAGSVSYPSSLMQTPPQLPAIWRPYVEAAHGLGVRLTTSALAPGRSSSRLDDLVKRLYREIDNMMAKGVRRAARRRRVGLRPRMRPLLPEPCRWTRYPWRSSRWSTGWTTPAPRTRCSTAG